MTAPPQTSATIRERRPRTGAPIIHPRHVAVPDDPPLPGTITVHLIRNLAVCAVEALDGVRPIEQFSAWITHEVAVALTLRRQLRQERHASYRDRRRRVPAPGAVQLSQPAAGVIEAAIVITSEGHSFAVAMRLEWLRGRWRATHLTVL